MSSDEQEKKIVSKVPKAPKPKINKIPRKISFIKLIEADDDSDSDSESSNNITNSVFKNKVKISGKKIDNNSFDDDRYEDSFDEEFGECETNPDSGNLNLNNF